MKNVLVFTALSLASTSAFSMINGTPIDWSKNDNIARLDNVVYDNKGHCTGTLVAGKFVITAAHCLKNNVVGQEDDIAGRVTTVSGHAYAAEPPQFQLHPQYDPDFDGKNPYDVGIISLAESVDYSQIQFFADLNSSPFTPSLPIDITGFGGTAYSENPLNRNQFTFSHTGITYPALVFVNLVDPSKHTTGGDSGSAWTNRQNQIVGIHNGGIFNGTSNTHITYGSDLHYSRQFILDTVNGWHYPTLANEASNGKVTITVQSLHNSAVYGAANQAPYTTGDLPSNIGGTCLTMNDIKPFQTCTYEIESQGGVGTLHLSDNESIAINKPTPTITPPVTSGGSSDGGSLGFLSIIGLLGLGFIRRK